jgi:hypothetical protein
MIVQKLEELDTVLQEHLRSHDELRIDVIRDSVYVDGVLHAADGSTTADSGEEIADEEEDEGEVE